MAWPKVTQYVCAVLLIVSSIVLAFAQALSIEDIANGVLMYIAQAFLLAGSIFGLDYYVKRLQHEYQDNTKGATEQQPTEH